jgi:Leucine-rich repeat (LRR) protein
MLDISTTRLPPTIQLLRGLASLEYLNLQDTGTSDFNSTNLMAFPSLKALLLGKNDLQKLISENENLFHASIQLVSLDLAQCNLSYVHRSQFSRLKSMQYLNLSQNHILHPELTLDECKNLSLLNISNNLIEQLSVNFTKTLLSSAEHRTEAMTIDIRENPLSCLCHALDFVAWLQSSSLYNIHLI